MVTDALQGIYENLIPTPMPFPTVDPQYAEIYEMWKKRNEANKTPPSFGERLSLLWDKALSPSSLRAFSLFLILSGLTMYLLLRRRQARAEEWNARMTERTQGTVLKAGQPAASRRAKVEYVWWGQKYASEFVLPSSASFRDTDQVTILLDPTEPECARIDAPVPKAAASRIVALAIVALGLGLLAWTAL